MLPEYWLMGKKTPSGKKADFVYFLKKKVERKKKAGHQPLV
jgi:hypothetical protein